jgi:hypothetical protein
MLITHGIEILKYCCQKFPDLQKYWLLQNPNFCKPFIFMNAVSKVNFKDTKMSTLGCKHFRVYTCSVLHVTTALKLYLPFLERFLNLKLGVYLVAFWWKPRTVRVADITRFWQNLCHGVRWSSTIVRSFSSVALGTGMWSKNYWADREKVWFFLKLIFSGVRNFKFRYMFCWNKMFCSVKSALKELRQSFTPSIIISDF